MSKKGENIYKRKDNRWEGRYQKEKDAYGRVRLGYVYGKTYHEVKEKLRTAKSSVRPGGSDAAQVPFSHVCGLWLQKESSLVRQSTYAKYRTLIDNHITGTLGSLSFSSLTPALINQFLLEKLECGRKDGKGGLSVKSVQDIYTILKSIIRYGEIKYRVQILERQAYPFPRREKQIVILSVNDRTRLEQAMMADLGDKRKSGILLCLYSGLRIGELCALRWSDLDFTQKILRISRTLQRISNPLYVNQLSSSVPKTLVVETSPKTSHSIREIPLPSFLWELLDPFRPADGPDAYFLTGAPDKFIEPRNYQYFFQRSLETLDLPPVKFHCLRHTFATRCIEVGFDVKTLSEILGHADVNITLNHYVHSTIQMKRMQMELLCS